jgi:hypothetical protein
VIVVVVLAGFAVVDAVDVEGSGPEFSDAIGALAPPVAAELSKDAEYLLRNVDVRGIGGTGTGIVLDLEERGYRVKVDPDYAHAFGTWRTARPEDVDGIVIVVGSDDHDAGYVPPAGAELIAEYDPLTPAQRARSEELMREIDASIDDGAEWRLVDVDRPNSRRALAERGADPAQLDELARLRRGGSGYTVYLAPGG